MIVKKLAMGLTIAIAAVFGLWLILPLLAYLPESTPEEVGLRWQECKLSNGYGTWRQAEECFGQAAPIQNGEENNAHAERVGMDNFRLQIGSDTYETGNAGRIFGVEVFVLSRNGFLLSIQAGIFTAHSPNIGLSEIGGKAAWEFADQHKAALIFDGQDVRRTLGVNKAQRPYRLGDKLIFIAQKNRKYFVVYDGKKIGPEFDEVIIAYCCEAVLYSPQGRPGVYLFNGSRNGQNYLVEISAPNQ